MAFLKKESLDANLEFLTSLSARILDHGEPEPTLYFDGNPMEEIPDSANIQGSRAAEVQVCAWSPEVISETIYRIAEGEHENAFTKHILGEFLDTAVPATVSILKEHLKEHDISDFSSEARTAIDSILRIDEKLPWRDGVRDSFQEYCKLAREFFRVELESRDIIGDDINESLMSAIDDSYYFGFRLTRTDDNIVVSLSFAHNFDDLNRYEKIADISIEDFNDHERFREVFSEIWNRYLPLDNLMIQDISEDPTP